MARLVPVLVALIQLVGRESLSGTHAWAQMTRASRFTAQTPGLHIFLEGKARMTVDAALEGAVRRLARPRCGELFSEFVDASGQPLSDTLVSSGRTAAQYVTSLYFVDADPRRCHADETLSAFTTPGSRVIHICSERFANYFALNIRGAEILLIHELLHSLGAGENPPSPATITALVIKRCND
jgi:hypothetical protein